MMLFPIIRLDDSSLRDAWRAIPTRFLIVRLQDVITKDSVQFNKTFRDIVKAGSLHNFLGFRGPIILSSIMRDDLISRADIVMYIHAIKSLKPDFFITPDGETYDKETEISQKEIRRALSETNIIIKNCPNTIPIGLVKGCNEFQVECHTRALKEMGIDYFVFHVGDFFRNGDDKMIRKARFLSSKICPYAKRLILYGMGSQKRLLEFSFADAYATFNYFTVAKYGMIYQGTKKIKYIGGYNTSIVKNNLIEMYKNTLSLQKQTRLVGGLKPWVGEQGETELVTHQTEIRIRA